MNCCGLCHHAWRAEGRSQSQWNAGIDKEEALDSSLPVAYGNFYISETLACLAS